MTKRRSIKINVETISLIPIDEKPLYIHKVQKDTLQFIINGKNCEIPKDCVDCQFIKDCNKHTYFDERRRRN